MHYEQVYCTAFSLVRLLMVTKHLRAGARLATVVAFRGGEPVKQFVGALPESGVRKFLEDV